MSSVSLQQQPKLSKPSLPPLSSLLKDNCKLPSLESFSYRAKDSTPSSVAATPFLTPIATPVIANIKVGSEPNANFKVAGTKRKSEKSFAFISHSPATYPSQEPSIDNAPLARRKRRRTSPNELNILNQEFILGSTPNKLRRIEIASKVSMTEKAVQIWFQNKRQSLRKHSVVEKEVTELPPTPNSSIVSSTPVKPLLTKAQSFTSPESLKPAATPIKQRAASTTSLVAKSSLATPLDVSTPNSSFADDSTIADNTFAHLNSSTKKNYTGSSAITFKLEPKITFHEDKENVPQNKIQSLLNKVSSEDDRKPLQPLNVNVVVRSENECAENLLSLKEGNWK